MKILLIAPRYFPIFNKENKGAIETLEKIYLRYNEKTDDSFVVYSPKIAKNDYDGPALKNTSFRPVDQTSKKYKIRKIFYAIKKRLVFGDNNECYIRTVIKDIKRRGEQNKYDLVLFENGEKDVSIFKKATKTKARIALHIHNDYLNKTIKSSEKNIDACDEIWTVSDFLAKQINEVKKAKTITIPNTIDSSNCTPNNQEVTKLKRQYDTKNNKIFIYVGRLLKVKGVPQLLEAFDRYSQIEPQSKLIIAGSAGGGKEGKEMQSLIKKYSSRNSNIIHLGYVEPSKLVNYQVIADCQIIPSMWEEAFGLVVLEAMRSNIKIIASDSGGIREVGREKVTYVDRGKIVEDLMKAIKKTDKKKLSARYYSEILDYYTEDNYTNNIYEAIHERKEN